ncbi:hypothetical protein HK405_000672, partial [Cladochytrium tenue]
AEQDLAASSYAAGQAGGTAGRWTLNKLLKRGEKDNSKDLRRGSSDVTSINSDSGAISPGPAKSKFGIVAVKNGDAGAELAASAASRMRALETAFFASLSASERRALLPLEPRDLRHDFELFLLLRGFKPCVLVHLPTSSEVAERHAREVLLPLVRAYSKNTDANDEHNGEGGGGGEGGSSSSSGPTALSAARVPAGLASEHTPAFDGAWVLWATATGRRAAAATFDVGASAPLPRIVSEAAIAAALGYPGLLPADARDFVEVAYVEAAAAADSGGGGGGGTGGRGDEEQDQEG